MYSDDPSCSDCKLEIIERNWTQLLLDWLNRCVYRSKAVTELSFRSLVDIIDKYKNDICADDFNKALLCTDDLEPYIAYKYPILRLRDLYEEAELPKKIYIMTSILLFHCCTNSQGQVESDICKEMRDDEQEIILKFCEELSDMEVTVNNINTAIKEAFEMRNRNETESRIETPNSSMQVMISSEKKPKLTFKSSITVLPSVVTETSMSRSSLEGFSDIACYPVTYGKFNTNQIVMSSDSKDTDVSNYNLDIQKSKCQEDCSCTKCLTSTTCCGDPGRSMVECDQPMKKIISQWNWKICIIVSSAFLLSTLVIILSTIPLWKMSKKPTVVKLTEQRGTVIPDWMWHCDNSFCNKVFRPATNISMYTSMSRCKLLCSGPQLWPQPIGYTFFSKTIVSLATSKLEYKFQSIPSDSVNQYLAEAFKLFLKDLARLEKIDTKSREPLKEPVKKMIIQLDIESDSDPRLRTNTDEAYMVKVDTEKHQVFIKISAVSFCGVRHGLETLSQLILLDQSTGTLITLSHTVIKDAPSYKYRGVMIDTGRNYIPVIDLMRTLDGMATCKLNTFHWRISDVTSFPLKLSKTPELFEHGGYDRSMVYTREDVKAVVKRAGIRGIRVLIEVALPGPVGRPWSWLSDTSCPTKTENFTCNNPLCLRLLMTESVFDVLQNIYAEIIELTKVDDIFHLSDGIFSLMRCNNLIEDRDGYLDKALFRLRIANKGFLPKLPIIWYSTHLSRDFEAKVWEKLGVQLLDWTQNPSEFYLSQFKVIHSTKWDLSCEMKKQRCTRYRTWQEMYSWKSWRNIEVFTIEGGEAVLWTDLVDTGNIDEHLWPRAAAVAERLWSDMVANSSATKFVYLRLDTHRWRMLLHGVKVKPIWPAWCSFNPGICLERIP
ncbi:unnamed protein product [Pieris macdunnoughi]|uniref:beta-N-acetylhexosaminidase n=1 Tax=Pieris macdunnoughi TaxID=345717 RepID=A0A821VFI4_9NEOP|nr:unnamed protein product [Pieris macdunnoughi]